MQAQNDLGSGECRFKFLLRKLKGHQLHVGLELIFQNAGRPKPKADNSG
jgi:hypothetical protein